MRKFYELRYDAVFKAVFGNMKTKYRLERLIKEAIGLDVEILSFQSTELTKTNIYVRTNILDVIVKCNNEIINIELNNYYDDSLKRRNACYIFRTYYEQCRSGASFDTMPKIIQINLNHTNSDTLLYKYSLKDSEHNKEFIDNLEIYEFNLNKNSKLCYNKNEFNILSLIDMNRDELMQIQGDDIMEEIKMETMNLNDDEDFVTMIDPEIDSKLIMNTLANSAKRKGHEQGMQEGMKEGMKEGIKETAREMLKHNIDINLVSEITKISVSELKKL